MLYYILPPIVIIISVSALIVFLFRKAEEISMQDLVESEINRRYSERKINVILSAIGYFGLKFLERLMHRSKLLSLKFHNMTNDWLHLIREHRQKKLRMQLQQEQKIKEEIKARAESLSPNQIEYSQEIQAKISSEPRAMIRAKITHPESRQQTNIISKDKLEEALIKRIALNPRDIEAYERLGDYYMESTNYRDALECFKQVLRLSPAHHKARLRIRRIERIMIQ